MILIFGGAYQGKLDYALDRFNLSEKDIFRCSDDNSDMPENKKIIYEIDKWILALVKTEPGTTDAVKQFIIKNKDAVVICNDISSGVVPIDPLLRKWRETVGRTLAALSRESDEVVRLFCGIPTMLK
ncbi:MAG: bifunctional adenosylcobinamide kinase/adenosylcobinamide-phosphate guanylyltransferase [Oscillospiraceae bacterium]|nr:bifunctional adenosylcobinamide kinase/adenosylcobinamide-phosphate guanylyltransferase [Oscillospiraceae bacterium]